MLEDTRPSPRHVILTILFALWLSAEAAVIGLTPAWGLILPHEHITRGTLTQADWERHLQEHLRGAYSAAARCDVPRIDAPAVVASMPDVSSAFSFFSFFTLYLDNALVKIPALDAPSEALVASLFQVFDMRYAPLEPPPNI